MGDKLTSPSSLQMLRYKLFGEKTNLSIQSKNYKEEETQKCFLLLFRNLFCLNFVDTEHLFKKTNQSLGFMMSIISCCRKRLLRGQVNPQFKFDILKMPGAVGQGRSKTLVFVWGCKRVSQSKKVLFFSKDFALILAPIRYIKCPP